MMRSVLLTRVGDKRHIWGPLRVSEIYCSSSIYLNHGFFSTRSLREAVDARSGRFPSVCPVYALFI
jgi:hypothetical protein